jgi:predicted transcriptional regulator
LQSGSQRQKVSAVRSQLAQKLVEEFGLTLTETGRQLGVSASAIAKTLYGLNKNESNPK